ncbi:probable G-protein coupled receptor No18 [Procambarus clarkii]|uniref:probable G-protein coupled receptor No18 n=1 Tax=Procambarus clarkii TaxID=6728 RepID=UPI003741F20D
MCKMYCTCVTMCCTASILNLCAIALDRYWAITDPINYAQKRTLKRVLIMISLVWAISFVISFPPLLGWNDWPDEISEEMYCYLPQNAGYVIYSALGSFFCPLVLMIIIYVKIYKATKRRLHERAQKSKLKKLKASRNLRAITLANPDENRSEQTLNRSVTPCLKSDIETTSTDVEHSGHYNAGATIGSVDGMDRQSDGSVITKFIANRQRISLTQERRLVRTLTIIMGSFVICWLPFLILYVILPFCSPCKYLNMKVFDFIQWLSYVNSAFNPVIYTVFNKDFRAAIHNIITCRTC